MAISLSKSSRRRETFHVTIRVEPTTAIDYRAIGIARSRLMQRQLLHQDKITLWIDTSRIVPDVLVLIVTQFLRDGYRKRTARELEKLTALERRVLRMARRNLVEEQLPLFCSKSELLALACP